MDHAPYPPPNWLWTNFGTDFCREIPRCRRKAAVAGDPGSDEYNDKYADCVDFNLQHMDKDEQDQHVVLQPQDHATQAAFAGCKSQNCAVAYDRGACMWEHCAAEVVACDYRTDAGGAVYYQIDLAVDATVRLQLRSRDVDESSRQLWGFMYRGDPNRSCVEGFDRSTEVETASLVDDCGGVDVYATGLLPLPNAAAGQDMDGGQLEVGRYCLVVAASGVFGVVDPHDVLLGDHVVVMGLAGNDDPGHPEEFGDKLDDLVADEFFADSYLCEAAPGE